MLSAFDLYALSRTRRGVTPCFSVLRVPIKFAKVYAAASAKQWTANQAVLALERASCTPFQNSKNMMKHYFSLVLTPSVLWCVASQRNDIFSMRRALSNHLSSSANRLDALETQQEKLKI